MNMESMITMTNVLIITSIGILITLLINYILKVRAEKKFDDELYWAMRKEQNKKEYQEFEEQRNKNIADALARKTNV